jgi:hypothetical protein
VSVDEERKYRSRGVNPYSDHLARTERPFSSRLVPVNV